MVAVVGFAGRIGSGKTTISRIVAEELGARWTSFGTLVRLEAGARGLPQSRESLQDLGDSMIAEGWPGFCRALLTQAGWRQGQGLVIDGIRHVAAMTTLASLVAPSELCVVYLDLSHERRISRLEGRGYSAQEIEAGDGHPNEAEVAAVADLAEVYVSNDGATHDTARHVLDRLVPYLA